jgi:CRP/FNR family transcriptional regulator, dissimilatory nitrate respiration regulator
VRVDPSGRETVLYDAVAGDTVAEASLFSPVYHCDAIATTDAVVRLYPKALLLAATRIRGRHVPSRRCLPVRSWV